MDSLEQVRAERKALYRRDAIQSFHEVAACYLLSALVGGICAMATGEAGWLLLIPSTPIWALPFLCATYLWRR